MDSIWQWANKKIKMYNNHHMKTLAIIGGGHIAGAIIEGLVGANKSNEKKIIVADRSVEKLKALREKFKIKTSTDNKEVVKNADWILIAVKPFDVGKVIEEIKTNIKEKILISVAAGVTLSELQKYVSESDQKIIRIMPNIPVAYSEGVVGLLVNKNVTEKEKLEIEKFFSQIGKVFVTKTEEEFLFFSLTPGCGPALVSFCIEMFAKSGKQFNLPEKDAEKIAMQIFTGTLLHLQKKKLTPKQLQEEVATKGGVTEQIIKSLNESDMQRIFDNAIKKGQNKIQEIENNLKGGDNA